MTPALPCGDTQENNHQVYMLSGVLEVYDGVVFEANVGIEGHGGAVSSAVDVL